MNISKDKIYIDNNLLKIVKNNVVFNVDLEKVSDKFRNAKKADINKFRYDYYGIHWDKLNEDLSIEGLIKDSVSKSNYETINGYEVSEIEKYKFNITPQKIEENINLYLNGFGKFNGREEFERFSSFDYCYNYFQSFKNKMEIISNINIEKSCLQLGFYLASWGMYRNTDLLNKSIKIYKDFLKFIIDEKNSYLWKLDINEYNNENINKLLEFIYKFKTNFSDKLIISDTLISKIMLGVFGNIPAFDRNFKKGFGFSKINFNNLTKINNFYLSNKQLIDNYKNKIKTLSFSNNEKNFNYPIAKIIDMIGFIEGIKIKLNNYDTTN
ncbi:MAG TPA: DUF2442 domain-containing protein [Ignavibacteria bacterium]|nr:DUF2442 domain-containing protein [Ignavibacteria bacterium]